MDNEIRQAFSVAYSFPVLFTRGAFDPKNPLLAQTLGRGGSRRHRVLVAVDSNVADATDGLLQRITAWFAAQGSALELAGPPFLVRGGEICKSDPLEVSQLHDLVARYRIDRQSFILAIGGGAVLDAVGFAAATAHRGVRLVRMPTTVLGQNDAGIGVKNGINFLGRKNFLGSFAPPFAVINDFDFLRTLPARDLRAGMAEAVKVAAIKDADFLHWIHTERRRLAAFAPDAVEELIRRCAKKHIEHVGGADPFELGSARPLDFGHWTAHALEELTGHELRHGEAVAIGCALDSLYAHEVGLLSELELKKLLQTLEGLGFEVYHPALSRMDLREALAQFREHLGGELCLTVPHGLGRKVELNEIDLPLLGRCVEALAARSQHHAEQARTG